MTALNWIDEELEQLQRQGLRRMVGVREAAQAAVTPGGVNFSANDYLGLASEPAVIRAATEAASDAGWGSGASPLVTGRGVWHQRLEQRLAEFEGSEAALLFPSGFAANAGVIPALVDEEDAIFADARNHASIIDGCRLSRAERFIYPHCDIQALDDLLSQSGNFRRRLIVTDSLFSMDGDVAPIDRLAELATQYDAMLMVDEAHATGVWGPTGRGVVQHFASLPGAEIDKIARAVSIRVGTLSKAIGSAGGFVTGSQALIDWLANRARSYVFSTASPQAAAAAACAAIELVEIEPRRRTELLERASRLREMLQSRGWSTGNSVSQIVPIVVGDPARTMELAGRLRESGLLVPGIRPPSVPEGESLLRVSLCHGHTDEHLERLVGVLGDAP